MFWIMKVLDNKITIIIFNPWERGCMLNLMTCVVLEMTSYHKSRGGTASAIDQSMGWHGPGVARPRDGTARVRPLAPRLLTRLFTCPVSCALLMFRAREMSKVA